MSTLPPDDLSASRAAPIPEPSDASNAPLRTEGATPADAHAIAPPDHPQDAETEPAGAFSAADEGSIVSTALPSPPSSSAPSARSYYLLAHTPDESVRQERQHWLFYEALGNHHLAAMPAMSALSAMPSGPTPAGERILDLGCGDGYWLRDMLHEWPQLTGVGVDLHAPTAPGSIFTSGARVVFVLGNSLEGLPFTDGHFYVVHQRMLGAALPRHLWPAAIAELVRVTAPAGWLECLEGGPVEDIPATCSAVRHLQEFTDALGAERGIELTMNARVGDVLRATDGLDPASIYVYTVPLALRLTSTPILTPTLRQLGDPVSVGPLSARAAHNWLAARHTLAPQVLARGWATEQQHVSLLQQAERELSEHAVRWPIHVAYARRAIRDSAPQRRR